MIIKNHLPYKLALPLLVLALLLIPAQSNAEYEVAITKDLPYLDVQHDGKKVRIERIQDTDNKLTNSFSKTSRQCPPFCVQPIELAEGVKTVGEKELLDFLDNEVKNNEGLLIDAILILSFWVCLFSF